MSFLLSDVLPVLNVHSKKKSMLKRKKTNSLIRSRTVIYRFNIHFFVLCIGQVPNTIHHRSMPKIHSIPVLFKGSFAVRDLVRHYAVPI